MVWKKGVPDWLNSPLWSSNPADGRPFSHYDDITLTPDPPPSPPPPPEPSPSLPPFAGARRSVVGSPSGSPSSSRSWMEEEPRESQLLGDFQMTLQKSIINLGELRRLACLGIPDRVRPIVWKLLLGYLPLDRTLWAHELERKHSQYKAFKDEFLVNPEFPLAHPVLSGLLNFSDAGQSEITWRMEASAGKKDEELNCQSKGILSRSAIKHGEHPLSLTKDSVWNQYFQESEILEQIDRDVKRTHPEMDFFSGGSSFSKANQEALRRILTIFAKLNPSIKYVQGMNEVLAPLFYVFRNDPDETNGTLVRDGEDTAKSQGDESWLLVEKSENWQSRRKQSMIVKNERQQPFLCSEEEEEKRCSAMLECLRWLEVAAATVQDKDEEKSDAQLGIRVKPEAYAEADTFFCFVELISVFRDNFCKQLDNSVVGIRFTIARLSQLLRRHDEELWRHLEVTTKVNAQLYAFRWITLLLTREFSFTECLRIWDTLLSDPEGPQETLLRICCAMLTLVRRRLLAGDFIANLKLLQNYPTSNISQILHVANKLRGPTVD